MALDTRWYLSAWMTEDNIPGLTETVPTIVKHAPPISGQAWGVVTTVGIPLCVAAVTYDDSIASSSEISQAWTSLGNAPADEVISIGSPEDQFSTITTKTAVLAKLASVRINEAKVAQGGAIRDAVRDIARHFLLFEEVGLPPAELTEPIGSALDDILARARALGFGKAFEPTAAMTVGEAYAALISSPRCEYGLESGQARFGHPLVHLAQEGMVV